jgi:hypothetical protein
MHRTLWAVLIAVACMGTPAMAQDSDPGEDRGDGMAADVEVDAGDAQPADDASATPPAAAPNEQPPRKTLLQLGEDFDKRDAGQLPPMPCSTREGDQGTGCSF